MYYYLADPHFSHKGILKSCGRPFSSAEEMDTVLLNHWRSRVKPEDTVFLLGDLFVYSKNPRPILEQLTGRLILVEGNHDALWLRRIDPAIYFERICPILEVEDRGRRVRMIHRPVPDLLPEHGYLLYGHLHNHPERHPLWPWLYRENLALNTGADIALEAGGFFGPAALEEWIQYNKIFRQKHHITIFN